MCVCVCARARRQTLAGIRFLRSELSHSSIQISPLKQPNALATLTKAASQRSQGRAGGCCATNCKHVRSVTKVGRLVRSDLWRALVLANFSRPIFSLSPFALLNLAQARTLEWRANEGGEQIETKPKGEATWTSEIIIAKLWLLF